MRDGDDGSGVNGDDVFVAGIGAFEGVDDERQWAGADLETPVCGIARFVRLDDGGIADKEVRVTQDLGCRIGQDEFTAWDVGGRSGEAFTVGGDEDAALAGREEDAVEDVAGGIGGGAGGDLGECLEGLLGQRADAAFDGGT